MTESTAEQGQAIYLALDPQKKKSNTALHLTCSLLYNSFLLYSMLRFPVGSKGDLIPIIKITLVAKRCLDNLIPQGQDNLWQRKLHLPTHF